MWYPCEGKGRGWEWGVGSGCCRAGLGLLVGLVWWWGVGPSRAVVVLYVCVCEGLEVVRGEVGW